MGRVWSVASPPVADSPWPPGHRHRRASETRDSTVGPPLTSPDAQVNEAFKDLSAIVDEQGHAIEQIEVNVLDAHANTEKGVGYLSVSAGNGGCGGWRLPRHVTGARPLFRDVRAACRVSDSGASAQRRRPLSHRSKRRNIKRSMAAGECRADAAHLLSLCAGSARALALGPLRTDLYRLIIMLTIIVLVAVGITVYFFVVEKK